jgi:hypothetical protein
MHATQGELGRATGFNDISWDILLNKLLDINCHAMSRGAITYEGINCVITVVRM